MASETKEKVKEIDYNEKVDFYIPFIPGVAEEDVYIRWNDYTCLVKRGETVQIPLGAKLVYEDSQRLAKRGAEQEKSMRQA